MAQVVRLHAHATDETTLSAAIEGFFASADFSDSTRSVYEATLTNLEQDLPAGIAVIDVDRQALLDHLETRYANLAPATYNRNRATLASLFSWCELITRSPAHPLTRSSASVHGSSVNRSRPNAKNVRYPSKS